MQLGYERFKEDFATSRKCSISLKIEDILNIFKKEEIDFLFFLSKAYIFYFLNSDPRVQNFFMFHFFGLSLNKVLGRNKYGFA